MKSSKPKTKWRYMYFGYLIRDRRLLDYGTHHGMVPDVTGLDPEEHDDDVSIKSATLMNILAKARLTFSSEIRSVLSYDRKVLLCITLGTNNPLDNLPHPGPEKWVKLKEVLETDKEPHWYLALV